MRLFVFFTGTLFAAVTSAAQDCRGGKLTVNSNGVNFGQISPSQLGLSSNDLSTAASPSGSTQINGPGELETTLDSSAYSGLPAMLIPELLSTNDWDWRCIMRTPVNRDNLVVLYQLNAASGQGGGLSTGGQFIPVELETDISLRQINRNFVEVSGRIHAFPDLADQTLAGSVDGTLRIEVFEQ